MELAASFARFCHFVLSSHAQKLQTESMEVAASFPSATSFCKAFCVCPFRVSRMDFWLFTADESF
jgi:hypothetical protein